MLSTIGVSARDHNGPQEFPTDTYELYIDPLTEAFPGQDDLLIPLKVSVSQPTIGVNVTMTFDPSLISPVIVAPNFFFQSFIVDLSDPGVLKINLLTDLPPPPDVPPIEGDTIFAWILCEVIAHDPGYDVMTDLTFFEDPYTPYPDNSLLLENGGWITPPQLTLTSGNILIFSPLYGDININGYPYEIGDAVTFMNYFMGLTEFNARQYANSDCNRDGIQATIADLVYLLCVINNDSGLIEPPPLLPDAENIATDSKSYNARLKPVDNVAQCEVSVSGAAPLGGACFTIEYDPARIEPVAVLLDSLASPMKISCSSSEGKMNVAIYSWNPSFSTFSSGRLFTVIYSHHDPLDQSSIAVTRAEFSDNRGSVGDFDYTIDCSSRAAVDQTDKAQISITSYPNPFNSSVSIRYHLFESGTYELSVYDILGRRVRTLTAGFLEAGDNTVIWDGTDELRRSVASGLYFARLSGRDAGANVKLFMIK